MFSASMTTLASPKAKFGLCFVIHFLIALDALIIVPFSAEMALSSGTSPSNSGLLVSAYAIAAAFACLWVRGTGNLSKEKYKIFIFLLATTLLTLLTSALNSFYILLFVRALTGICGGVLVVLNLNLVIQISHENDKKKDTAILLSAFPLALAIGIPALLFITANQGWQLGFLILGSSLAITALLFTFIFLSNIKQASQSSDSTPIPSNAFNPTKTLKYALFIAFFVVLSTFAVSTQFPVMLITNLNISSSMLSASYLFSGVCSFVAVQLYARSKLNNHTTSYLIYFLSALMILAALFGFTIGSTIFAAGLFTLFVIASATRSMILVTELITSLHAEERSTFISLQNAIQHFAIASGGTIASLLVTPRENHTLNFNVLIVVSALLIVITVAMWRNFQRKRF
ncbi:MFS transporter [Pseudoalteromonas sp. HM-SA03]|uniref:MFS transporter n=1 Tax=Pseudoalteromonas sp. HM-SA03 TaxID=2029678 RepID=UPI000BAE52B8|nr:MFS transporter [Pseudoalteromonas sp. HM-SA03]PAY00369.1 MFS transporter [Pseudoalteromonas sp. HM-SA03]